MFLIHAHVWCVVCLAVALVGLYSHAFNQIPLLLAYTGRHSDSKAILIRFRYITFKTYKKSTIVYKPISGFDVYPFLSRHQGTVHVLSFHSLLIGVFASVSAVAPKA